MQLKHLFLTGSALLLFVCGLPAAPLSVQDAEFLKVSTKSGLVQVELGKLAATRGSDQKVIEFAKRMVTEHSKLNQQLSALAATKAFPLPEEGSIANDASVLKLKMLPKDEFDQGYMKIMVDDHKQTVGAFVKESLSGSDPDVKAIAAESLPVLQQHQIMANAIASKLVSN